VERRPKSVSRCARNMIGYLLDWLEWRPPRTTPSNDKSPTDHIDSLPSYTTVSVALEALILQSTDNEFDCLAHQLMSMNPRWPQCPRDHIFERIHYGAVARRKIASLSDVAGRRLWVRFCSHTAVSCAGYRMQKDAA
jgi:hypothetical protein